jgi:hypothetical protein
MSNAKLRAHIGLSVPESPLLLRNGIRVGNEVREWVEGKALFFDDSFEHEVWWRSPADYQSEEQKVDESLQEEERVLLIIDVFHPELQAEKRAAIRAQMAAQHARDAMTDSDHSSSLHGDELVSQAGDDNSATGRNSFSLLAGGYKAGDHVRAIVAHSDRVELQAGEQGVVAGPGQGPDKLFVDFGARRWHLTPDTLMRELEYTADHELQESNRAAHTALEDDIARNAKAPEDRSSSMSVRVVRHDPLILAVENFISEAEITLLRRLGWPLLKRSGIQHASARAGSTSELRTSTTAFLGDTLAFDPALIAIQKRATAFSGGLPWTHAECMQLVSYQQGQRFATHTDYFEFWCVIGAFSSGVGTSSDRPQ